MSDPVKEQLSACLDGELPEGELDLLLKRLKRDPQLRQTLGRYALIGEALKAQGAVAAPADFASRVSAAIDAEPPLSGTSGPRLRSDSERRWTRTAAGLAVAAGVAAVAILAVRQPQQAPIAESYVAEVTLTGPQSAEPETPSYIVPASRTSGFVPAARLTNYVVAHSEYSTPLGRRSVLSGVLAEEDPSDGFEEPVLDDDPSTADAPRP